MANNPGFFSFLKGKATDWANRAAENKFGDRFLNQTDPTKRRMMQFGAIADGIQSLASMNDAPPPPEVSPPGTVAGGRSIADVLQMIGARRRSARPMGRSGVRGLFG